MHYFQQPYSEASIKEQYRSLAKRYHPDKAGNVEVMKLVNEEKELLLKLVRMPVPQSQPQTKKQFMKSPLKKMVRRPRVVVVMPDAEKMLKIIKELRKFK